MKANKILTIIICTVLAAILVSCGLFVFSVKEVVGEFSLFDPTDADRLQNILDDVEIAETEEELEETCEELEKELRSKKHGKATA